MHEEDVAWNDTDAAASVTLTQENGFCWRKSLRPVVFLQVQTGAGQKLTVLQGFFGGDLGCECLAKVDLCASWEAPSLSIWRLHGAVVSKSSGQRPPYSIVPQLCQLALPLQG